MPKPNKGKPEDLAGKLEGEKSAKEELPEGLASAEEIEAIPEVPDKLVAGKAAGVAESVKEQLRDMTDPEALKAMRFDGKSLVESTVAEVMAEGSATESMREEVAARVKEAIVKALRQAYTDMQIEASSAELKHKVGQLPPEVIAAQNRAVQVKKLIEQLGGDAGGIMGGKKRAAA